MRGNEARIVHQSRPVYTASLSRSTAAPLYVVSE
jgi:hypothetical protein